MSNIIMRTALELILMALYLRPNPDTLLLNMCISMRFLWPKLESAT